jgi:uncharacterized protein DUF6689
MKKHRIKVFTSLLLLAAAFPTIAHAQIALTPKISGNEITAKIQLPGGIEADLVITFEQVVGLNPGALALSAGLVDPSDPSLLARLPAGGLVSLPATFPVLVRVEPTASSALSFSGVSKLSIHTHALTLTANSPLRIFKAPNSAGTFQDMTGFLELGTVRAGGGTGSYSDFVIVADTRPVDTVIADKFDSLQSALTTHASTMPPAVVNDLQQRLANARGLYEAGSIADAISAVLAFGDEVKKQSGSAIPDVYRANSSVVNVAGLLRAGADTLKFSLAVKANTVPRP